MSASEVVATKYAWLAYDRIEITNTLYGQHLYVDSQLSKHLLSTSALYSPRWHLPDRIDESLEERRRGAGASTRV